MKQSMQRPIQIVLTLVLIAGLFMPYAESIMPMDYIFPNPMTHVNLFIVTIPILATVPFLFILIFKDVLTDVLLSILKVAFLLVYGCILAYYIYLLIESILMGFSNFDFISSACAIGLSLGLLIAPLKYSSFKTYDLQHAVLAIMTLPYIFYLLGIPIVWGGFNFSYGGYLIYIAFFICYSKQ